MKEKTFPFEPRTLLVNDPLFVYFNVYFMTFVVLNAHWLNLLLSTWWKHYLMKKPKAADWPSGEVQLDFLIWLGISNLLACLCHEKRLYEIERAKEFFEVFLPKNFSVVLKMETEFKPLPSTDF